MIEIEREFTSIKMLKDMIRGFEMLTGSKPTIYIITKGARLGLPAGVNTRRNDILFCNHTGHKLAEIGNRYLTVFVNCEEGYTEIDTHDTHVTFHARLFS